MRDSDRPEELMMHVEIHRESLEKGAPLNLRQMSAIKSEILENINSRCLHHIANKVDLNGLVEEYAEKVHNGALDSQTVAEEILRISGII